MDASHGRKSEVALPAAQITVGITCDTRPEWNGPEGFMLSIEESTAIGYT